VLPRLSQFKELSKASLVSSQTSLSIGLPNLSVFPQLTKELEYLPKNIGLTITLNANLTKSNSTLLLLLSEFQMPVVL